MFRVRDPGFELYLYGTRAHFSLKNAKGWPPLSSLLFLFLSLFLSLSLTAWHYSLLPRAWCEQGKTVSPINLREQTGETSQIKSGWIYERTRATISFCLSFLVVLVTGGVLRLLPFLWSSSPPAIRFPSGQQPAEEHGGLRGVRRGGRSSKYFWGRKEATSVTLPRVCSGGDENNAR